MAVFDTHCHLSDPELRPRLTEILGECKANGVAGLALISADFTSLEENKTLVDEIRQQCPDIKVLRSAGIHPHEAKDFFNADGTFLEELWEKVVDASHSARAIGETGLDFYYNNSDAEMQKKVFHRHIDLACESQKPLVIHCRSAAAEILECLRREDLKAHPNPGILHCFAEDAAFAREVLKLNFHISFSGIITFKNADTLREIVKEVPLNRLLVETDSPWLAPVPHRGKKNRPSYVPAVLEKVVELRSEPADTVRKQIWENSCRIFSLN